MFAKFQTEREALDFLSQLKTARNNPHFIDTVVSTYDGQWAINLMGMEIDPSPGVLVNSVQPPVEKKILQAEVIEELAE